MKTIKDIVFVPERARGIGNIQKNFDEKSVVFDGHHAKATYKEKTSQRGVPFKIFRMEAKGEKCYLSLKQDYESIYPRTGVSILTGLLKSGETLIKSFTTKGNIQDDAEWTNLDSSHKSYYGTLAGEKCRRIKTSTTQFNDFKWNYEIVPEENVDYVIELEMYMDKSWDFFSFNFVNTSIAYVKQSFDTYNKNKPVYYDNKDPLQPNLPYKGMWICNGENVFNAQMPVSKWFKLRIELKDNILTISYPSQQSSARIYTDFKHTFKEAITKPFSLNFSYWGNNDNLGIKSIKAVRKEYHSSKIEGQLVKIWENGTLLDQQTTNNEGMVHYKYSSPTVGKHTITFTTKYSNGWEATSKSIDVYVYKTPSLSLEPKESKTVRGEKTELVATLVDDNGKPLPNERLVINEHHMERYSSSRNITDNVGQVTYLFEEDNNWGAETILSVKFPETIVQNHPCKIKGWLKNRDTDKFINKAEITLWRDYIGEYLLSTSTNKDGQFEIEWTPDVSGWHMLYCLFDGQYGTLAPTFSMLMGLNIMKSPAIEIDVTKTNLLLGEEISITVKLYSRDNPNVRFNEMIYLYEGFKGGKYNKTMPSTLLTSGKCVNGVFEYKSWKKAVDGEYTIYAEFLGNKEYASNSTSTKITVTKENISLETVVGKIRRTYTETIVTTLKDSSNKPIVGETINWYIGLQKAPNFLVGSAVTDSKGVAKLSYVTSLVTGITNLYTEHPSSKKYNYALDSKQIEIIKATTQLSLSMIDLVSKNQKVTIKGKLTKSDDKYVLGNKEITLTIKNNATNDTTTKTLTTNSKGEISYSHTCSTVGTFTVTIKYNGDVNYTGSTDFKTLTVKELIVPTITLENITGVIGTEESFTAGVDSNTTGKYYLYMIIDNELIKVSEMTHDGTIATYSTDFTDNSKFKKGKHQFYIEYEGDVNYSAKQSEIYNLFLADDCTITFDKTDLSCTYGGSVKFSGTIKNEFGENYTQNVQLELISALTDQSTEIIPLGNITCKNGKFNYTLDTTMNTQNFGLYNGIYYFNVKVLNETLGTTVQKSAKLKIGTATCSIDVIEMDFKKGDIPLLRATVPKDATGNIRWKCNINGTTYTLGLRNTTNMTVIPNTNTKSVTFGGYSNIGTPEGEPTIKLTDLDAGIYEIYATLTDDKRYLDARSSNKSMIIRQPFDWNLNSTSIWEKEARSIGINHATDTTNNPLNGTLSVNIKGSNYSGETTINRTISVNCIDGEGSFTIPASEAVYELSSHRLVLKITATYQDDSSLNRTKTSYVYILPRNQYGLVIKNMSAVTEETLQNWSDTGFTDLYFPCYFEKEEYKSSLTSLKLLNSTYRNKFRWHAIINIMKDRDGNSYLKDNKLTERRLTELKNTYLPAIYEDYAYFSGICIDQLDFDLKGNNSKLVGEVNRLVDEVVLTKKSLEASKNTHKELSMYVTCDYAGDNNTLMHGHDYEHLRTKVHRLIPKTYQATQNPTNVNIGNFWTQNIINEILKESNAKRLIASVEGVEIIQSGSNYNRTPLSRDDLDVLIQGVTMWGSNGFILTDTARSPHNISEVLDKTSTAYSREVYTLLSVNGVNYKPNIIVNYRDDTEIIESDSKYVADENQVVSLSKSLITNKGIAIKYRDLKDGWVKGSNFVVKLGAAGLVGKTGTSTVKINGNKTAETISKSATSVKFDDVSPYKLNQEYTLVLVRGGTTATKTLGSMAVYRIQFTE